MDVLLCFDNILNKNFITYEVFFSELVDKWRFGNKNEDILVMTNNRHFYSTLNEIANLYWEKYKIEINVKKIGSSHKIQLSLNNRYMFFTIVDYNTFKYENIRNMRLDNIIIDVDDDDRLLNGKSLNEVKLPFNKNIICYCLKPILCRVERGFLTLMY